MHSFSKFIGSAG